ncbi:TetR/AcrR family transcriptional regulator [Streptomyces hainanensis]|uniref:TetR/AcrR family transcriptional regulator n=1 Tax=Streptomyces hainanensis TaxID=402648 RepID=A0A4R4TA88_9ACTN|nr:TetR/AcrR family transcriptional regulator [Streptomyces hainanensis]TDC74268.1 TetR/AcrR family transcriptional regulator [Streptomyces hainanensis]
MSAESSSTPVRRPRMTPERELELLTTAVEVLREVGYEALTMDAVAVRARCSKATLYRLWPGKPQLVAAALYATRPVDASVIDTGTLRGDLLAFVGMFAAQAEKDTALVAGLAHVVLTDPDLARALRETLIEPEHEHVMSFVGRAVERGELPGRPAATAFMPQMLFAALLSRPLFEDSYADTDYLARFIDDALLPALRNS